MAAIEAKNLLLDKTCDTCKQYKGDYDEDEKIIPRMCMHFSGTMSGWQWRHLPEENTCEDWKEKECLS